MDLKLNLCVIQSDVWSLYTLYEVAYYMTPRHKLECLEKPEACTMKTMLT